MASVTTNYGFDVPTSSDLVKNGATQIALLGQDLDTFLFRPFTCNGIINGGFDIWQRGTSIANDASYTKYCADRFQVNRAGLATGATISRQSSSLTGIQYAARVQRDSGNTNTGAIYFLTALESADSYRFAGQSVTISFYARAGANYSSASSALSLRLDYGTGTDQSMGTGFTGQTAVITQTATLTTSWQRFTYTGTVASAATEIGFYSFYTPVGTAGANDYYEITGIQLEVGSQASPFIRAGGNIQGELAMCQRYYFRSTQNANLTLSAWGSANTTTTTTINVNYPTAMRTTPSAIDYSSVYITDGVSAYTSISSITSTTYTNVIGEVGVTIGTGTLTQFRGYKLVALTNGGYIGFSAELQEMTMDNVTFTTVEEIEYAIIDHGNDEFTSMPKADYDELKANEAKTI